MLTRTGKQDAALERKMEALLRGNDFVEKGFNQTQLSEIIAWKVCGKRKEEFSGSPTIRTWRDKSIEVEKLLNGLSEWRQKRKNTLCTGCCITDDDAMELINGDCGKYAGPVIAVTLLYFVTKGEYPIFDRFAVSAVNSITGSHICESYSSFKNYQEYKRQIESLESEFRLDPADRRLDRALWAYGHLQAVRGR